MTGPVPLEERLRRRGWAAAKSARRVIDDPVSSTDTKALAVLGCQRSGTTMMVEILDKDWRVRTFHEFSAVNASGESRRPWSVRSATRYSIRLQGLDRVARVIGRSRFPLVVLKPLVESQRAPELASELGASCLWMYRHYRDVARSNVKIFGADIHRTNLEPIVDGDPANWRSERASDEVRALVAKHYSPSMNPYDGAALFWWARNQLYFDLDLESNAKVMLLRYEDLAAQPERWMRAVYDFAEAEFPGAYVVDDVHPRSVGLGAKLELSPAVEAACEEMWRRLDAAAGAEPLDSAH